MKRRDSVGRLPRVAGGAPCWLLGALLLAPAGCAHQQQARLQSEEDPNRDRYEVKTVGSWTTVGNAQPVPVGGVGLVVDLEGTGGDCPPDGYRAMLEDQLRKKGVKNVKEELSAPDHAMVIVTAQVPPGAREGDPLDVEVSLPAGSRATSLRGGCLKECLLFNYDSAANLSPQYADAHALVKGHPLARAKGPVLVGVGDGDEEARLKKGRIWGGGRCLREQPLGLLLNPDHQYARDAARLANRINEAFNAAFRGAPGADVATARNNLVVTLRVPAQYRLNLPRFLRVVRLIPLSGEVDSPGDAEGGDRRSYRQRLADDLLDPAHTVVAALRLEALGQGSIRALKQALESKHALVRFCAAESLAYLGSPACGEELARAVAEEPMLRAFGLTAMASLDEAICQVKLGELLQTATDDETRYGAFRALRALDERNQAVRGELLNESFWMHRVAPATPPLVHISTTRRAEVVLFGERPCLKPPFRFLAGEFVVTASEEDTRCTVSRFPLHSAPAWKPCALEVEDVLRTMADLGAMYPEVVALLQQADQCQCLSCRVRSDALPQAASVYDLAEAGRGKPGKRAGAPEPLPGGQELGATPTLFDSGLPTPHPPRARGLRE
jgi:hypothetical protein